MVLKDIFAVGKDENLYREYQDTYNKVKENYNRTIFEEHHCKNGYARNTHTGKLKDGVDITELELSMLLDRGFSHFGGSSSISKDGSFTVVIYTD